MSDINLLPQGYGPDPAVAKLSGKIVRAIIVEFFVLLVIVVLGIATYYVVSNRIDQKNENLSNLKSSIATLEGTEQRLFLLKDRIDKADIVMKTDSVIDDVIVFEIANSDFSTGVTLENVKFLGKKIEAQYDVSNSRQFADMLLLLKSSNRFSYLELLNLDYTQNFGYSVILSMSK